MRHKINCIKILTLFVSVILLFVCGCNDRNQKNANKVSCIQDLNSPDFIIGGMTGIAATREAQTKLPKAQFKEYSMPIDAFTAICSNKIDAVVLDRPTLEFMSLAHPELAVMQDDLAIGHISIAAAKKNKKLMKKVNEFIRSYRTDGTYREMYDRWFHSTQQKMPEIRCPEKPDGVIKIGVTANNEPLCFIKDGELAGFDSEFSRRFAAFLKKDVEFVDMPYDALVIGLASGKIDLAVAFMDAMPEREESVLFSESYIDAPITMLVQKPLLKEKKFAGISSPRDLNTPSCTIAIQTEILASKEAKKLLPLAKYQEFSGPADCYTALSSGKARAIVYDRPALEYAALDRPEFLVLPENIATGHISVAANRSQKKLIEKVNEFIRKLREDGTSRNMYDRWIRSKNAEMPDIAQPQNPDGKIVIGIDPVNPPLCFIKDKKYSGFDIEFCERLALFLNKKIEYKAIPFDGLISAMHGNKIDLAVAQMDATPERAESILFSDEYIESAIAAMIRKNDYSGSRYQKLEELKGKKVGTTTGSAYDLLAKPFMPEYELMSFTQMNQGIAALESGKIEAFFTDAPIGRYLLLQRPKLTIMPVKIPCGNYAYAFRKDNTALCNAVSAEIRKMKQDGTLAELQNKWFSATDGSKHAIPASIASEKTLRIGAIPELPPFAYVQDGKIVGYDIEIATLAANHLGYHLEVLPVDMSSFMEGVRSGKYDFIAGGITITDERKENVLFGEHTYDGGVVLLTCKGYTAGETDSFLQQIKDAYRSLTQSFEKTFIRESRWKLILQGLATTLVITVFSVLLGTLLAFPICMMCRSKRKLLVWLGDRYVSIIMGTPILVILMILYYVIFAKVDINGIFVAILAFAMDFAAYTSVTLRSGIEGIPRGQTEAALALGHSPAAAFLRFVLPQAVRTVLPVYRGEIISTLKSTSVVGYIAIMDLTKMGDIIRSRTYEAFFPLIAIALIYFLTAKGLTSILLVLENKLNPETRKLRMLKRGVK